MASRSFDIPGEDIPGRSANGGAVDLNFSGVNIFPPSAPSRSISGVQHRNNVNSNQRVRPLEYPFDRAFNTALGGSSGNQQRQTRSRPAASPSSSLFDRAFPTAAAPAQRSNPFHPQAPWESFPLRTSRQGPPGDPRHLLAPANRQDRQPSPSSSSDSSLSPPPSSLDSSEFPDLLSGLDSSSPESEVIHELRSVAQRVDPTPSRRPRRVGLARPASLRHSLHSSSSPPRRNHPESSPASTQSPATAPNNYQIPSPQINTDSLPVSSRTRYSSSSSAMSTAGASRPHKRRATSDDAVIIPDSDDFSGSSPIPAAPAPPRPVKRRNTRQTQSSVATSSSWQQQQPAVAQPSRQAQAAAAQSSREAQAAARRTTPAVKKQPGLDTQRKPFWKGIPTFEDDSDLEEVAGEVIDLVDREDIPIPEPPKEDNSIKLGKFQCVICMDDCTDLTVTHCGHLFCSECLHSSLHIDATKKICPICRQKVDTNPASGRFTNKSKGFWPLELKLMTKKSSKKRAAR